MKSDSRGKVNVKRERDASERKNKDGANAMMTARRCAKASVKRVNLSLLGEQEAPLKNVKYRTFTRSSVTQRAGYRKDRKQTPRKMETKSKV